MLPSNTKSRKAAFRLLLGLLRRNNTLMEFFLTGCLGPLSEKLHKPKVWDYAPPNQSKNLQEFVGLRNLGCICYMNSILQQFFNIPAFRYNLLAVDDGANPDLQPFKGEQVDDNLLHQLQKLMSNLELSERSDYNPYEFCFAFKEVDGRPTNIGEQKDA